MHILLEREQDFPPSLLYCTFALDVLGMNNEVHKIYFCYVLLPFLFIFHDVNDKVVDKVSCLLCDVNTHSILFLFQEHTLKGLTKSRRQI